MKLLRASLGVCVGSACVIAGATAAAQTAPARVCTARPAASFHLRPRPVEESVGRRYPARTELVVLDDTLHRTRAVSFLRRVRVVSTGAVGYTFVAGPELGPACVEPRVEATEHPPQEEPFSSNLVRRGRFATPEAGLAAGWTSTRGPSVDVDNDGQLDQLLSGTREGRSAFFVALRRGQGWEVHVAGGENQETLAWEDPIVRGAEVWLRVRCISQGETGFSEQSWSLYRFDARVGAVRLAAMISGDRLWGGEQAPHPHRWRFEIASPGVLQITGDRGAPLVLRFDAQRWTLDVSR